MHDDDVLARLDEQQRHQRRVAGTRQPKWILGIFVAGACVSIFGLVLSLETFAQDGLTALLLIFSAAALFFGWVVVLWLTAPLWIRPRIVPYFARELGRLGGPTMIAFRRGRALYREIVALDGRARAVGVTPLSAFGFAYDHYDQAVRWHPAAEGLRSVEALRHAVAAEPLAAAGVKEDLDALAEVLRSADAQGVDFSLVLRLYATESLQAVCTREERQGSFW